METIRFKKLDYMFMPKNSGLKELSRKALSELQLPDGVTIKNLRGEDIPYAVAYLSKDHKFAAGITGDDLYDEARYSEPDLMEKYVELVNTNDWLDKRALYGRPVLALIAKKGVETLKKSSLPLVGIPSKYKNTSKRFLKSYFGELPSVRIMNGSVEEGINLGLYELAVDIVYSGSTIEKNSLKIVEIIRASDLTTIASKGIAKRI